MGQCKGGEILAVASEQRGGDQTVAPLRDAASFPENGAPAPDPVFFPFGSEAAASSVLGWRVSRAGLQYVRTPSRQDLRLP